MQADSTPADRTPIDLGAVLHDLDRTGHVPLYHQIATRLRDAIANGTLPTGSRLENEVALAERIGVSRPTMRRASGPSESRNARLSKSARRSFRYASTN